MNTPPLSKPGLEPSDFACSSGKPPTFTCPGCGAQVPGIADYIARGVKCAQCGLGFAPVDVRYRGRPRPENTGLKLGILGALVLLIVVILRFGQDTLGVLVWIAPTLLVIGLLVGIFIRLGKP